MLMVMEDYEDIINLPHHVSKHHPQMPMISRAAQFAPFAALTGYDAAISESARLTDGWIERGEAGNVQLNRTMEQLLAQLSELPYVSITFFQPDQRKHGGSYLTCTGRVKRIDDVERVLQMADGRKLQLDYITEISIIPASDEE